jgi:arylsulfatase A-like enzyme
MGGCRDLTLRVTLTAVAALGFADLSAPDAGDAAERRPNVLVIVTDDQRAADTLRVMPETRGWLARGGTRFNRAFATTPLCCPSRASILTGLYAHNHGVRTNDDALRLGERATIASHLDAAGYATGIVGKYLNRWPLDRPPAHFDEFTITNGGYSGSLWNVDGVVREIDTYSTTYTREASTRFIRDRENRDGQPWLLYVAPLAPHLTLAPGQPPYFEPEPRYRDAPVGAFRRDPAMLERSLGDKPAFLRAIAHSAPPDYPSSREVRAGQLRLLMSVDDLVGELRGAVLRAGELDRTLVIFASDNGFLWGEHGAAMVKDLPYPAASRIPLLATWPGELEAGAVDRRLTANIDLAPTILDAAGLDRRAAKLDGRSLLDRGWHRDRLLLEYFGLPGRIPPWASLVTPEAQLTLYRDPRTGEIFREYYGRVSDPFQLRNPFGNADQADDPAIARLLRQLRRDLHCAGRSCP